MLYPNKGEGRMIHTPNELPDPTLIAKVEEPHIRAQIISKTRIHRLDNDSVYGEKGVLTKQHYSHLKGLS